MLRLLGFIALFVIAPQFRAQEPAGLGVDAATPDEAYIATLESKYSLAAGWLAQAVAAYREGDHVTFLSNMELAASIRGDHPTYLYYLAAAHALNGDAAAGARTLQTIASWGIFMPAESEEDFAPVRDDPAVRGAFAALRANQTPAGVATVAFEMPANGGLWEGIAHDYASGDIYLSDLHHGQILRRTPQGNTARFASMPASGFGCGGMAIDAPRGLLWVSSPAMPEVDGFTAPLAGQSRLVAFRLADGTMVHDLAIPAIEGEEHTVVDLTVGPDGTVYAPDSTTPVVWSVPVGTSEVTRFVTVDSPGDRHSLQGAAVTPDGHWLIIADYSTGLHAISLTDTSHRVTKLRDSATTLLGIDGIALVGDLLYAVQNGVQPTRVIAFRYRNDTASGTLHFDQPSVIARALPGLDDPTLLVANDNGALVVGNAGWPHFGPNAEPAPSGRIVTVLQLPDHSD